jgi:two-component system chemotaxis sensor kinase CheA
MTPLLEQFLSEAHELLDGTDKKLMQLEKAPEDETLINELFRLVHTLKGNSGLFTFPEMTRVLHASEDLLGMVRGGQMAYSRKLTDQLLEAMDFVGLLCDEIESTEHIDASRAADSARLAEALRMLLPGSKAADAPGAGTAISTDVNKVHPAPAATPTPDLPPLFEIPEAARAEAFRQCGNGESLYWIDYTPTPQCFFQGDDPFYTARRTPGLQWGRIVPPEALPPLAELDTYRCVLRFQLLSAASREEIAEYYRYLPDQVRTIAIQPQWLVTPQGGLNEDPTGAVKASARSADALPQLAEEDAAELSAIVAAQRQILMLDDHSAWRAGQLKSVAGVLINASKVVGDSTAQKQIESALAQALTQSQGAPLLTWLDAYEKKLSSKTAGQPDVSSCCNECEPERKPDARRSASAPEESSAKAAGDDGPKFGRRAEDAFNAPKSLKVDQAKIDRLMNLIGEMIVSKNALPYLAQRAEVQFGVRELSREIKAQYAIINRITDEMQDAIMQVRMMSVSFVFQRFPRLVRDISHKLGKEVQLVLEGEETQADKNIIEALADPLMHIVRNSLDHGLEIPEVRRAQGKSATGVITMRAAQEADRVLIEIIDDGKGVDPAAVKRKAYEKGLIDEAKLEQISDREAVNLIFAAGLSTAEKVTDLSGRGVGMDVVRTAIEKINGTVQVDSTVGKGTSIRISLPLSMAVTQVMVIESDGQQFGVPMDHVVETVRIPRSAIHLIKQSQATVLRGRIVPLKALNTLLGLSAEPKANADDELAVLLVQANGEILGLLVDGFRETIGIIQKPLSGVLSGLSAYSGSALMGDGSVLMVLNIKEVV